MKIIKETVNNACPVDGYGSFGSFTDIRSFIGLTPKFVTAVSPLRNFAAVCSVFQSAAEKAMSLA